MNDIGVLGVFLQIGREGRQLSGGRAAADAQPGRRHGHQERPRLVLALEVLVVGDGEPFIAALITLDKEMLPQWLRNHGLAAMDVLSGIAGSGGIVFGLLGWLALGLAVMAAPFA